MPVDCINFDTSHLLATFRIYSAVRLLFSACIFLTYFLQFYVPMVIIQPPILKRVPEEYRYLADYGIRITTVIFTCKFKFLLKSRLNDQTFSSNIVLAKYKVEWLNGHKNPDVSSFSMASIFVLG